jgi:hypothetical protein
MFSKKMPRDPMERRQKAQLRRILQEFPWLWAVRNSWLPGFHFVTVQEISRTLLYQNSSESHRWWVKIDLSDLEQVIPVNHHPGSSVADTIVGSFSIGKRIHCLVREDDMGRFIVFRAPRGEDLHKMVCGACSWTKTDRLRKSRTGS